MLLSAQLVELMTAYAEAANVPLSTASKRAAGTASTIARLRSGGGITDRRYVAIVQWFSDHWPEDAPWPDGIHRPSPSPALPDTTGESGSALRSCEAA